MSMRVKVDPEVICWSKLENETLLLNLETGFYYTLDEVGGLIWEMLLEGKDSEQILDRIVEEYDVQRSAAAGDLTELLTQLQREGIIDLG